MTPLWRAAASAPGITGGAGRPGGSRRRARRLLRAGGRLRAGAVLAGLVLLGAAAPVSAQALTWSVVPSPSPGPGSGGDSLNGVSCVSATACAAVGFHGTKAGVVRTLAESWNGARWSVVPSPSPGSGEAVLESVSCVSATACTAVGVHVNRALAESWNGARWSVVPSPNPGSDSDLHSVSCTSAGTCTAAGYYATKGGAVRTLVESWNGARWAVVPSPNPGTAGSIRDLSGVSCTSASACTATGVYFIRRGGPGRTLVESWNGARWAVVPSPSRGSDSYLEGVSCASAAACTATGYYTTGGPDGPEKTLAESWNGVRWSVVPSPSPHRGSDSDLASVSCISADWCTATGSSVGDQALTLIESWNGTRWSVVPSPNRGNASYLNGVSCTSASACTATGYTNTSHQGSRTLVESGTASR